MPEPPILPPIATAPLSVVLLTSKVAAPLDLVLGEWMATLDQLGREYEILVVDLADVPISEEFKQRFPALKVLPPPEKPGVGAALKTSLAAASHRLLLYAPCDQQYHPADLRLLLTEIDKVHLVSGYRKWQPVPLLLRALGATWRGLLRLLFSIPHQPLPGWLGWRGHLHAVLLRLFFGVRLQEDASPSSRRETSFTTKSSPRPTSSAVS
jgi:hypothetical protein